MSELAWPSPEPNPSHHSPQSVRSLKDFNPFFFFGFSFFLLVQMPSVEWRLVFQNPCFVTKYTAVGVGRIIHTSNFYVVLLHGGDQEIDVTWGRESEGRVVGLKCSGVKGWVSKFPRLFHPQWGFLIHLLHSISLSLDHDSQLTITTRQSWAQR